MGRRFKDMQTPEQQYLTGRAGDTRKEAMATETRLAATAFPGGRVPKGQRAQADATWQRADELREQAEQLASTPKKRWWSR